MLRAIAVLFLALVLPARTSAADTPPGRHRRLEVAPTKTSIYIGTVSMTLPTLVREGGTYVAPYAAEVFPFFFYNEEGVLRVDVTDAQLEQLARGETIEFSGRGVRSDGVERRVAGKATPSDADTGRIKVRVLVSKRIELIFNTTYRFLKEASPIAAQAAPTGQSAAAQ